jgi:uncharacterized ion transporter superfamily protein YfcC
MSEVSHSSGGGFGSVFMTFLAIFAVMYFMWYYSGGPQKEDSNKAFVEQPTYQNYNTFDDKYGTVPVADKLNRQNN